MQFMRSKYNALADYSFKHPKSLPKRNSRSEVSKPMGRRAKPSSASNASLAVHSIKFADHSFFDTWGLTNGLWSPLRGFARTEHRYKALLQAADEPRRGDLDGRGNLTQAGLIDWIGYTLEVCIDQVGFMARQLDITSMRGRIEAALAFEAGALKSGVRAEALNPLHYLFATQTELGRAEFKAMTGLGERVATELLSALVRRGFVLSDTPYGKLRFAVPRHALRFYFPALWPEAEQDEALLQAEMAASPTHAGRVNGKLAKR